ncbi:MAG: GIY-YIG nuclease family protein [bacterium]
MKNYHVYMMCNTCRTVIYTGMTNDLRRRVWEHKSKKNEGFTKSYCVDRLVYVETFHDVWMAIAREKQIKGGSRKKKETLIKSMNRKWQDLSELF